MSLLLAYIIGIGIAIASSVPVGPINFAILQTVFTRGKRDAMMIGLGGMIADTLYCFLGLMLYDIISGDNSPAIFTWLNLLTIPVVIILGYMMIAKRNEADKPGKPIKAKNGILVGITLGISNPVLLGYWLWVSSVVMANQWIEDTYAYYIIFTLGVATGIGLFFFGFINLAALGTRRMTNRFKSTFSLLVGIGFIGFGIYLAGRYIWLYLL